MTGISPYTIAVIGAGASGILVAAQLTQHAHRPVKLLLIERRPLIGRGVAYSTTNRHHLLNTPAGKMSAYQDRPDHFVAWLMQHHDVPAEKGSITPYSFVPRYLYGAYLQGVLEEALALSEFVTLERIHDEAYALSRSGNTTQICLKSSRCLHAHQVILALGNVPSRNPFISTPTFYESLRYRNDPWAPEALAKLPKDTPVFLLGSGLTMVDVAVALRARGHSGPITVTSRRGLLPLPHSFLPLPPTCLPPHPSSSTILALVQWIRDEISQAVRKGVDWRCVIDALMPRIQSLWQMLPLEEKRRFLRHVRPYWEVLRYRMAPDSALAFDQMRRAGQLQVYAGRVSRYDEGKDDVAVTLALRYTRKELVIHTGRVINCTGLNSDIRSFNSPLIANLLEQGLIRPGLLGIGMDTTMKGTAVNGEGYSSSWLWTLGSLRRGQLWETTALAEIRQQAQRLAWDVLQHMHEEIP